VVCHGAIYRLEGRTYDDCELIRDIYKNYYMVGYDILHNAGGSVKGKEVIITNIAENQFVW